MRFGRRGRGPRRVFPGLGCAPQAHLALEFLDFLDFLADFLLELGVDLLFDRAGSLARLAFADEFFLVEEIGLEILLLELELIDVGQGSAGWTEASGIGPCRSMSGYSSNSGSTSRAPGVAGASKPAGP